MNELPTVLQNEIWEYVRGDRAFWTTQHKLIIDHMKYLIAQKNDVDVNHPSSSWANRNLICRAVNEHDNEVEHSDHLHARPFLFEFETLAELPLWARRIHIKNPKYHVQDLSFLLKSTLSSRN